MNSNNNCSFCEKNYGDKTEYKNKIYEISPYLLSKGGVSACFGCCLHKLKKCETCNYFKFKCFYSLDEKKSYLPHCNKCLSLNDRDHLVKPVIEFDKENNKPYIKYSLITENEYKDIMKKREHSFRPAMITNKNDIMKRLIVNKQPQKNNTYTKYPRKNETVKVNA